MVGVVVYLIIGCLTCLFLYYYLWARSHYGLWRSKGVRHPSPSYLLGNGALSKIEPGKLYGELYRQYRNEKYVGLYEFSNPRLLLIDPRLIQNVLIKDFSHFTDRGTSFVPSNSSRNNDGSMFMMTGHKWRAVRNKLSPTFTTGKLKTMFDRMSECCSNMDELIATRQGLVDARELMFSCTLDIIASCAFGLDINKEKQTAVKFREMGMKALSMDFYKLIGVVILTNFPFLRRVINMSLMNMDSMKYMRKVLMDALTYRRETGQTRNDFLQLLIQLKDKGTVEHHAIEPDDEYLNITKISSSEKFEFTENMVMGQAFTFITAGMEPSGNTLTMMLCELAWRQDVQSRARAEIQQVLEKNDNQFSYNALRDMEYLENCILEILRLYPVAKQLRRVCTKRYQLDDRVTIEPGTSVVVPVQAIQLDPEYYPNPHEFNPDRFKDSAPLPCTFFPFGEGPRICIGMRFALVEMKVILSRLIYNYKLTPGDKFTYPIPLNRWSFFSLPDRPVHIKLEKITRA